MSRETSNTYSLPLPPEAVEATFLNSPAHMGPYKGALDLAVPPGTSVLAPLEGVVAAVEDRHTEYGSSERFARKANFVQIEHSEGEISDLIHLGAGSEVVKEGDRVAQGQEIAKTGLSGWLTDPHLHWDVFVNNDSEVGFETLRLRLAKAAAELVAKKEIVVISTNREGVFLRQLALPSDDVAYFEAINEDRPHVDQHGNNVSGKYKTIDDVRKARLEAGAKLRLGIWDGSEFKGSINATPDEDGTKAEVGYWLRASAVGHGYATLAAQALTDYLQPRYKRLFAEVHIDNQPSIRVLERAGYMPTGEVERDWGPAVVLEPAK